MAKQVYAYDNNTNDFKLMGARQWRSQITNTGATNYLRSHLKQSVINDFSVASSAYISDSQNTQVGKGFFALLRILFPTITFLGTLYKGKDYSTNAIAFMNRYLGRVNPKYRKVSDIIYNVYRHGLMHTQMPKMVKIGTRLTGWSITYNTSDHLRVRTLGTNALISICPQRLYEDLLRAIEFFITDINNARLQGVRMRYFKQGFVSMAEVFTEKDKSLKSSPRGVRYIKSLP